MIILLAIKDRAESVSLELLVLGPGSVAVWLNCSVAGTTYLLEPPPDFVAVAMSRFLKSEAGLGGFRARLGMAIRRLALMPGSRDDRPDRGTFWLRDGAEWMAIRLNVRHGRSGERLDLEILGGTTGFPEVARSFLARFFEIRPAGSFTEDDLRHYKFG